MLCMVSTKFEEKVQYAMDAKIFLVKIFEKSFSFMNTIDENATKYKEIIETNKKEIQKT